MTFDVLNIVILIQFVAKMDLPTKMHVMQDVIKHLFNTEELVVFKKMKKNTNAAVIVHKNGNLFKP